MAQTIEPESFQIRLYGLHQVLEKASPALPGNESKLYDGRVPRWPCFPVELSIWHQVNSDLEGQISGSHQYWWAQHSGKALAVLLYHADYSSAQQHRHLKFFAQVAAPCIGPALLQSSWKSFMTDDGTPIELSWDWGTNGSRPTVRYSIEAIGPQAGTSVDPQNLNIEPEFERLVTRQLPETRLELYHHFKQFFNNPSYLLDDQLDVGGHRTNLFYAFDLGTTETVAKAYFFPKTRAAACKQSSLDVILESILSIPNVANDSLEAFKVFSDFAKDTTSAELEHEMLAIDLVPADESRLKIYFRSRDTSFNSVINIMSLGGSVRNPKLAEGLLELRQLWQMVLDTSKSFSQPLGPSHHRTAGILYNVEFRTGDAFPVAKIYLPVRHYAASDEAVILGLNDYFQHTRRGQYMPDYVRAMSTLL